MSPDKCLRVLKYLLITLLLIGITFVDETDGWKLRDLTQKGDENKLSKKTSQIRDAPMRKIVKVVRDVDNDDDDDDDNDNGDEDNDNDGADDDVDSTFVFEKVHSTHFDLPPLKPVAKLSEPDVEQEEDERLDEQESGQQVASFFDPIMQLFNFDGMFDWLSNLRKAEEAKVADDADDAAVEEKPAVEPAVSWLSYLNRYPFNLVLDYFLSGNDAYESDGQSDGGGAATGDDDDAAADERHERKPLTTEHFEELLLSIPSFVPNYTNVADIDCKRMGQIFQRQVRGQKLWALQMMDASAKIPSGLLRGNANQLGDFDLCTEIRTKIKVKEEKSVKVKGKYCLANIDVTATDDDLKLPVHLMQGRNLLRSRLDDPSHFLPRFSTLKWGICVPSACSNDDAEQMLNEFLHPFNSTGIKLFVDIEKDNCYVQRRSDWNSLFKANWQMSATVGYFTFFVVVTIIASLNDYWKKLKLDILFAGETETKGNGGGVEETTETVKEEISENESPNDDEPKGLVNRMLMSFSIKNTGKMLFSFDNDDDDEIIYCIYGLKGLATIFLFISLKFLTIGHVPFTNRAHLTEILNSQFSVFVRSSFLYMDVFLLASGFFAGYKMSKDLEIRFRIPWMRRFLGRFIRLTPSLVATVLFSSWIFPYIGSGPQWGQLIQQNSELCQQNFFKNIFYIQNWFSFKDQCAPQLQQLAIDFQLFLAAPVIVWLFQSNVVLGFGAFGLINAFSAAMRYSETISERMSFVVFHGMKLTQFYRTLNLSFASPLQRATPYFVGLGLGVMLCHAGRNIKLPKAIYVTGWLTCLWSLVWCFWAPNHLAHKDYVYEPTDAAQYAAWAPLVWSLAISWIIFVVFTRNDGILTKCLTIRPLIFLSRISYQIFLIQFFVLFYKAATARSVESYGLWSCIDSLEIGAVVGISVVTAILFDLPLQTICKMIVDSGTAEDIAAEEERQLKAAQETEAKLSAENEAKETVEHNDDDAVKESDDIKSQWVEDEGIIEEGEEGEEEEEHVEEPPQYVQRSSSLRSYSPVWKKDDEEPPAWGDDDDDDNVGKKEDSEEEEESEEEDEESDKSVESVRKL